MAMTSLQTVSILGSGVRSVDMLLPVCSWKQMFQISHRCLYP